MGGLDTSFKFADAHKNLLSRLDCFCSRRSKNMSQSFEPDVRRAGVLLPQALKKPLARLLVCLGAGSNRRPLPLQGNALPTELPKHCVRSTFHVPTEM